MAKDSSELSSSGGRRQLAAALDSGLDRLTKVLLYVATLCGMAIVVFVAFSTIRRYVFGNPLRVTEEIVGLLTITLVFLPLPYLTVQAGHINVTAIHDLFPANVRKALQVTGTFIAIIFCIVFGLVSFNFAYESYVFGSATDVTGLLLYPWMGQIPFSLALVCVILIRQAVKTLRG